MAVTEQGHLTEARREGGNDDPQDGEPPHAAQRDQQEARSWKQHTRTHPCAGKNAKIVVA